MDSTHSVKSPSAIHATVKNIPMASLQWFEGKASRPNPQRGASYLNIKSLAKGQPLLYVSDAGNFTVDIFTYSAGLVGSQVGQLSGFYQPQGLCTDGSHVWVTNTGNSTISEYARGGSAPVKVLFDANFYPVGCSYDKTTGNLAVTNIESTSGSNGNIAIYTLASGNPAYHYSKNVYRYYFCGYDSSGNLWFDGQNGPSGSFAFAELAAGKNKGVPVTLSVSIGFPGQVQSTDDGVTVGDQSTNTAYDFPLSDVTGSPKHTVVFGGAGDVVQFWIDNKSHAVFGPDAKNANVGNYKWAVGGNPIQLMTGPPFVSPNGATMIRL
jgi:hypothetical protein